MIRLATLIQLLETELRAPYRESLLPAPLKARAARKDGRTSARPTMPAQGPAGDHPIGVPPSGGHRRGPHGQPQERPQWLERPLPKRGPGPYFLLTFTLPAAFQALAFGHQSTLDTGLIQGTWQTVNRLAHTDTPRQGTPGGLAVRHTPSRRLDDHPPVHWVVPAAAIDAQKRVGRTKRSQGKRPYRFHHQARAKVCRAQRLEAITAEGLGLPPRYAEQWIVPCPCVGSGEKALVYLGRYLSRWVIREQDILACETGQVTVRDQNAQSQRTETRTVSGAKFLWRIRQHVVPKGFRRARHFGFLHPNSKPLIAVLQVLFGFDPQRALAWIKPRPPLAGPCGGAPRKIIRTGILPSFAAPPAFPIGERAGVSVRSATTAVWALENPPALAESGVGLENRQKRLLFAPFRLLLPQWSPEQLVLKTCRSRHLLHLFEPSLLPKAMF